MPREKDILVPRVNFAVRYEGRELILRRGWTHVRAGHPIVKGREHLFEPVRVDYDVEQATAAPGEKRNVQLPAPADEPAASDVRAWATEQGITVPPQGRLSAETIDRYKAAHADVNPDD